jgi:hypothetical protein
LYVTGTFDGVLDAGGGYQFTAGDAGPRTTCFVVALDPTTLQPLRLNGFDTTAQPIGCDSIAAAGPSEVYVAGTNKVPGAPGVVVTRLDSTLNPSWSLPCLGGFGPVLVSAAYGEVVIAGESGGGGSVNCPDNGNWDTFPDGAGMFISVNPNTHILSKGSAFGSNGNVTVSALAVSPLDGNIVLGGTFTGSFGFSNGPSLNATTDGAFVAGLHYDGSYAWQAVIDNPWTEVTGLAMDAQGATYVTGTFYGMLDVADASPQYMSGASRQMFVAKMTASGTVSWVRAYPSANAPSATPPPNGPGNSEHGAGIAAAVGERAVVSGLFYGSMDLGGSALTSGIGWSVFAAKLDETNPFGIAGGTPPDWNLVIGQDMSIVQDGTSSLPQAVSIAVGPNGETYLAGNLGSQGSIDLGTDAGVIPGSSIYVVELAP